MSEKKLSSKQIQVLRVLSKNSVITTGELMKLCNRENTYFYSSLSLLERKEYVQSEILRRVTANGLPAHQLHWRLTQKGNDYLLALPYDALMDELPDDRPAEESVSDAPSVEMWRGPVAEKRIVDVMHGPVYAPPKWEPPRPESAQCRQYSSRGVRC